MKWIELIKDKCIKKFWWNFVNHVIASNESLTVYSFCVRGGICRLCNEVCLLCQQLDEKMAILKIVSPWDSMCSSYLYKVGSHHGLNPFTTKQTKIVHQVKSVGFKLTR